MVLWKLTDSDRDSLASLRLVQIKLDAPCDDITLEEHGQRRGCRRAALDEELQPSLTLRRLQCAATLRAQYL